MPANLKASLRKLRRLKKGESCHSLKYHFCLGVMREIVGAWEAQLRKWPNDKNFLWVDVPWTIEHTVKGPDKRIGLKERKERGLTYSRTMVEKAYLCARELGIVSRPFEQEIDGEVHRGFILAPHDALCRITDKGCQFVGPGIVRGTSWHLEVAFKDEKPTSKRTIVFKGFLRPGTQDGTDLGTDEGMQLGTHQGMDEGTENIDQEGDGKRRAEIVEVKADNRKSDVISQPKIERSPVSHLSQLAHQSQIDQESQNSSASPSGLLTDENRQLCNETEKHSHSIKTVGQHFEGVDEDDVLRVMTDGEFDEKNSSLKKFDSWANLRAAASQVVTESKEMPLKDRKSLAHLIGKVISTVASDREADTRLFKDKQPYYPKALLSVKGLIAQGGPLKLGAGGRVLDCAQFDRKWSDKLAYSWLNKAYHRPVVELQIDLQPFERFFALPEIRDGQHSNKKAAEFIQMILDAKPSGATQDLISVMKWLLAH
jgi:hypothetical protein